MRARFDIWWALFLQGLRSVFRETNPSYARLLQALPQLRADAARPGQKFVLTALVQEWREENAERFGLFKDIHFPVGRPYGPNFNRRWYQSAWSGLASADAVPGDLPACQRTAWSKGA